MVGPTGLGKSALAVDLALEFGGEVINADSRLFYRGFDIGTAKPDLVQRRGVPHHLIDILGPGESFSLAEFLGAAGQQVADIGGRGRLPVLVGGTGQYVWGLLEGWEVPKALPDGRLRRELEAELAEKGVGSLHARLQHADARAAAAVDPKNPRRVIRALERAAAGLGGWEEPKKAAEQPYDAFVIGVTMPRAEHYARLDARIDAMVAAGWVEEVRGLVGRGVPLESPAMSSIGYRELAAHLRGELALDAAVAAAKKATRRLVRHQYNWFKLGDGRITWLQAGPAAAQEASGHVRRWLTGKPIHQ